MPPTLAPDILFNTLPYIDRAILLAVRQTCRAIRRRADAILFEHIVIRRLTDAEIAQVRQRRSLRASNDGSSGGGPTPQPAQQPFMHGLAQYLDIYSPSCRLPGFRPRAYPVSAARPEPPLRMASAAPRDYNACTQHKTPYVISWAEQYVLNEAQWLELETARVNFDQLQERIAYEYWRAQGDAYAAELAEYEALKADIHATLSRARVVDVLWPMDSTGLTHHLSGVQMLRFQDTSYLGGEDLRVPVRIQAPTSVVSIHVATSMDWYDKSSIIPTSPHTVICLGYESATLGAWSPRQDRHPWTPFCQSRRMTLIFGNETQRWPCSHRDLRTALARLIADSEKDITLVGLESFHQTFAEPSGPPTVIQGVGIINCPSTASGPVIPGTSNTATPTVPAAVIQAKFLSDLRRMASGSNEFPPDAMLERAVNKTSILTMAEYERQVGREVFELTTIPIRPWRGTRPQSDPASPPDIAPKMRRNFRNERFIS